MDSIVECYAKTAATADKYTNMFQLPAPFEKNWGKKQNIEEKTEKNRQQ